METNYKEIETVSFPSSIDNIKVAEDLVDEVCRQNEVHEDHFGNVLIAVTEAVNNAIHHGNLDDPNKTVSINVKRGDDKLCFVISDAGKGFDFENLPDPTSPENIEKENGRGIFLMKSLADEVSFEKNGAEVHVAFSIL
jgi:serine/threonine-protein kinase RsbW